MHKNTLLVLIFFLISQCSLDTKTGFWSKTKIVENKNNNLEEIFKPDEVLEKEFKALILKIHLSIT